MRPYEFTGQAKFKKSKVCEYAVASCGRDGGRPTEIDHQEIGLKPPHAAVVKSNGRE
ncbi:MULTISPECIES: hypothetical protein [unclassified Legionella]|nr:hypothetical protein [Legionella sp. 31fI33]MCC5013436.1 hypothetical protein [Legionella sp. 31fI33]MCC5015103.1 hypothetical protein [Legionella sp. 31fI33]